MLALLTTVVALAAGAAVAPELRGFRDWQASCDNHRRCTALTFDGDPEGETQGYLKLDRGFTGPASVTFQVFDDEIREGARGTMSVVLGGPKPLRLSLPATVHPSGSYWTARPSPADAARLTAALKNASTLEARVGSKRAVLSTSGSAATLLWLDERQGRLGKPMAPPTVEPPVRPAAVQPQTGLPKSFPAALNARADVKTCREDIGDDRPIEPIIARLAPGRVLYGVPCSAGAYNFSYLLLVADEQGRGAAKAPVTYYPGYQLSEGDDGSLVNPDYDPATRTLTAFNKGRGLGDCGSDETWVWDGAAFRLTRSAVMGECEGVPPDDWPVLYTRAVAR